MNIFIVDRNPVVAARSLCDKHIVKMCLESAQMLSTAHSDVKFYESVHFNHPCSIWTRSSLDNYAWHLKHAIALCEEYTRRYKKLHEAQKAIDWCYRWFPDDLPDVGLTPFVAATKGKDYNKTDVVERYRAYYIDDKAKFAVWRYSDPPSWWPFKA